VRAGGQIAPRENLTLFTDASYENRRYGGPEPFFETTRHDDQYSVAVGARYVPARNWLLTPQLSFVNNHSNVVIYDFTRYIVSVTLRRAF
jgi:hypothetical protein